MIGDTLRFYDAAFPETAVNRGGSVFRKPAHFYQLHPFYLVTAEQQGSQVPAARRDIVPFECAPPATRQADATEHGPADQVDIPLGWQYKAVVKKTFRSPDFFLICPMMPRSFFRKTMTTCGITASGRSD